MIPLVVLVGCGGGSLSESSPAITTIEPGFGPVAGGVNITITGEGFLADGAPPNRVLVDGIEAPLAAAVDDSTLVVTLPPGEAGDATITVFNRNGQASVEGMFRYSTAPTITAVSPADVLFNSTSTTVTLTGTGFQSENAGVPTVLLDGRPVVDVQVVSDTELTFTALPGTVLDRPSISITNTRGVASRPQGFRYIFSSNPTLMAFTRYNPDVFMYLFDPLAGTLAAVPNKRKPAPTVALRGVARNANGDLYVLGVDNQFGVLDLGEQRVVDGRATSLLIEDFAFVNNVLFATVPNRSGEARFGRVDLETLEFTPVISTAGFGRQELAVSGTTVYYTSRNRSNDTGALQTIIPATGQRSAIIPITPSRWLNGTAFIGNAMWGVTLEGEIVSVDTTTGALTVVASVGAQLSGLEVFQ